MPRRLGWLGGSFDPVHEGHLRIARLALERLGLEFVLLVPAARPPHKLDKTLAPGRARMALLDVAAADDPRLVPCDIELERDGPSYSVDTAEELLSRFGPDVELYSIVGADTLADLPTWHRIGDLVRLVTFCPVTRAGVPLDPSALAGVADAATIARIEAHRIDTEPHPASSTSIREALLRGERPQHVPPAVLARIRELGLYGAGGGASSDSDGSTGR